MSDADQILRSVLSTIATDHGYEDCDTILQQFSTGGANYTSHLYRITLSAPGKNDLKLFAKVACVSENIRAQTQMPIFDTEMFFYSDLLKQYKEIEESHNVSKKHRLATTKFYGCNKEYLKEILVLEDLSLMGFDTQDRLKSFNWEYASTAVVELAKLHALSIDFQKKNPEQFEKLIEKLKIRTEMENFKDFINNITSMAMAVIKEENKGRMEAFLKKFQSEKFDRFMKPIRRPVIAHGDFRPSNLMHRIREDGQLEVVVLDYQTLQVSNPIMDLMYFIVNGSDEEFRGKHYRQLLDHYYSELCKSLTRLGLDPNTTYPKEDFEYELKEMQPYGLLIGVIMLPMVTVAAEDAPKMDSAGDIAEFAIKPNELAATRLNGVINDFIKLGVL